MHIYGCQLKIYANNFHSRNEIQAKNNQKKKKKIKPTYLFDFVIELIVEDCYALYKRLLNKCECECECESGCAMVSVLGSKR